MRIPEAIKNNIIIEPQLHSGKEGGYTTAGGIFVPEAVEEHQYTVNKNKSPRATVISIGPGVDEVVVGDVVLYNKHAAKSLGPGYDQYVSINIHEIFAVVQ